MSDDREIARLYRVNKTIHELVNLRPLSTLNCRSQLADLCSFRYLLAIGFGPGASVELTRRGDALSLTYCRRRFLSPPLSVGLPSRRGRDEDVVPGVPQQLRAQRLGRVCSGCPARARQSPRQLVHALTSSGHPLRHPPRQPKLAQLLDEQCYRPGGQHLRLLLG